jgi:hypothetical protein
MSSNNSDDDFSISQRVEGLERFSGKTLTLSFYAKGSIQLTGSAILYASPPLMLPQPSTIVTGTSWTKHTVTFTVGTLSAASWDEDSFLELRLRMHHYNGIAFSCDIAQVQLEEGTVATAFEQRPIGTELALCQRYYETGSGAVPKIANQLSTTFARTGAIHYKVTKQRSPDITVGLLTPTGHDGTPGALNATYTTLDEFCAQWNWTGGTAGRAFSTQFTWTADAEL